MSCSMTFARLLARLLLSVALSAGAVMPCNAVTIDWVTVGDPGNAADTTGVPNPVGAVAYEFRIMRTEWTNDQYVDFLNAVDPEGLNPYGIYRSPQMGSDARGGINFSSTNTNGSKYSSKPNMGNKPVNLVMWLDAARVANWLQSGGQVYATTASGSAAINGGVYDFGSVPSGNAPAKAAGAIYWIPTENEWYKAAYYKGGSQNAGYWDYATQSDVVPTAVGANSVGTGASEGLGSVVVGNFANYDSGADWNGMNGNVTTVGTNGGPSAYGTFDMTGNVSEWNSLDGLGGTQVSFRGGGWADGSNTSKNTYRVLGSPSGEQLDMGFRLATVAVPEPSAYAMALAGVACLGWQVWRHRQRAA
jgi:sulfatase modifying factor 1